jgi:hypothetical protein
MPRSRSSTGISTGSVTLLAEFSARSVAVIRNR